MGNTPIVLFVNHLQHNCGVFQFFKRMTAPVVQSSDTYWYIETNQEWEHDHWVNTINPDIIVYNFYYSGATMPWLTNAKIASQNGKYKQICLFHEGTIDDKGFDLILHQNPFNEDIKYHNLPRPIPEYHPYTSTNNDIPVIGTFGFGLGGKGFGTLVNQVTQEFDEAHIRMNIPFAHFGDSNGNGARGWADHCRTLLAAHNKPKIQLTITHDMLPEQALLDFLSGNDLNAFLYDDNIGRGISGTLDYALAIYKPIAITRSDQFKHMWHDNHILSDVNGLKKIMNGGIQHLYSYHYLWNNTTLIDAFNTAFQKVMESK